MYCSRGTNHTLHCSKSQTNLRLTKIKNVKKKIIKSEEVKTNCCTTFIETKKSYAKLKKSHLWKLHNKCKFPTKNSKHSLYHSPKLLKHHLVVMIQNSSIQIQKITTFTKNFQMQSLLKYSHPVHTMTFQPIILV